MLPHCKGCSGCPALPQGGVHTHTRDTCAFSSCLQDNQPPPVCFNLRHWYKNRSFIQFFQWCNGIQEQSPKASPAFTNANSHPRGSCSSTAALQREEPSYGSHIEALLGVISVDSSLTRPPTGMSLEGIASGFCCDVPALPGNQSGQDGSLAHRSDLPRPTSFEHPVPNVLHYQPFLPPSRPKLYLQSLLRVKIQF